MNKNLLFAVALVTLSGCAAHLIEPTLPAATEMPPTRMPDPDPAYCEQNENKFIPAVDDTQKGLCIFPDGSACDEWAYYRRECCPSTQECSQESMIIKGSAEGGPLGSNKADVQASGGYMPPGTTEAINDWWGVIKSTGSGAQYDDYFERQDLGQIIYIGIDSMDPGVKSQINALRDTGKIVHLYGTLYSNVPDYNGSQVLVERIEVN